MQAWALDQTLLNRINFGRSRRRAVELIKPKGDVIGMRVEILRSVSQSPKSDPRGKHAGRKQGGQYEAALFVDIAQALFNGIVVEMKFIVADLAAERVLFAVGGDDDLKCARAKMCAEGLAGHFFMKWDKHLQIISGHMIKWL